MARLARIVVPDIPHHVTQRGNRRMQVFFSDEDYQLYLDLMKKWCNSHQVAILAYCLMPNHVHLIVTPSSESGLRQAIGEAHRRYTRHINSREKWQGYLWQERLHRKLVIDAFKQAVVRRRPLPGLIFHSDRGVQYACSDFSCPTFNLTIIINAFIQIDPDIRIILAEYESDTAQFPV